CAVLFALAAFAASAAAETPAPHAGDTSAPAWAYDLPNALMSPFCPGRTRDDVEQELYGRYGEVIRSAPKVEGFGAAAYWIPAAVFAGGGALVGWFLRRA